MAPFDGATRDEGDPAAQLTDLAAQALAALGDRFVGMYLYGSLALGDFDPATSDLDFVVVTDDRLDVGAVHRLRALHESLWDAGGYWTQKLEGTYLPRAELARYREDMAPVPCVNERRFFLAGHGRDWILQRYVLREHPAVVAGPPIAHEIEPVGPHEIRAAVRGVLAAEWQLDAAGAARLAPPAYQAFAVLTMCRALHAIAHGTVASKPVAARWAAAELGHPWADLIEAAAVWRPELPLDRLDDVLAFVTFAVRRASARGSRPGSRRRPGTSAR